jgi:hypothetical protein
MKKALFCLTGFFMCVAVPEALAQRMQDLSMSPSEMMQQPQVLNNTQQNRSSAPSNGNIYPNQGQQYNTQPPQVNPSFRPSNNYMDGYCDPNFQPAMATSRFAGMQSCQQELRQNSCARYQALPADAKAALDEAINCLFTSGNGDDEGGFWGNNTPRRSCGDANLSRLDLMKKYWADENVSYALVFLPDDVMGTSGQCLQGR